MIVINVHNLMTIHVWMESMEEDMLSMFEMLCDAKTIQTKHLDNIYRSVYVSNPSLRFCSAEYAQRGDKIYCHPCGIWCLPRGGTAQGKNEKIHKSRRKV
jgi:hypothetical protein